MARGFLPTLGVATTDRIQTSLTTHALRRTYAIWSYNRSTTNASLFDKSNAGVQFERINDSGGTSKYTYKRQWSGGLGEWAAAGSPGVGVWAHFTVTVDGSSLANLPGMYFNGVPQTVTNTIATSGTISSNTDSYWIGNRGNGDRGFDGMLAEAAIWDRILSPVEIQLLAGGWSPALFKAGLVEYLPLDGTIESKVRGPLKPTTTGTLWQPHPMRIIQPTKFRPYFLDRVDWVKQPWKFQGGMGPLIAQ